MKSLIASLCMMSSFFIASAQRPAPDVTSTTMGDLSIQPIQHASFTLTVNGLIVSVDPSGVDFFKGMTSPDIIIITHIHGDHFDVPTIESIKKSSTILIVPQVVADKLPPADKDHVMIMRNGDQITQSGITIQAIPMYNIPDGPTAMHPKGLGNGYVLTIGGKRLYISGDTQGIPEMRALKNIDVAFVCMNLPYTMDIPEAVDAVLAFAPKIVYPYHYRGKGGFSDVNAFKAKVDAANKGVEVRLRDWYGK